MTRKSPSAIFSGYEFIFSLTMKKKILIITLVLILLVSGSVVFLNNIFLPQKLKVILIQALQERTQKKVSIGSIKFSLFSGLVLQGLSIYDDLGTIVSLKEGSCAFVIPEIFRKAIIIPQLKLDSLIISLERRADGSFNIEDFLFPQAPKSSKGGFSFSVLKIIARNSLIKFHDASISPPLNKEVNLTELKLYLSLPAKVKFELRGSVPGKAAVSISSAGTFDLARKDWDARASILNCAPAEFAGYYRALGVSAASGIIDSNISIKFKQGSYFADLDSRIKSLGLVRDKISANINSELKAKAQYNPKTKQTQFSGKAALINCNISGIEAIGQIEAINAQVKFDNSGIFTESAAASIWGQPLHAKLSLAELANPLFSAGITTALDLASVQRILKDKLQITLPGEIKGKSEFVLNIQSRLSAGKFGFGLEGFLDTQDASFRPEKLTNPFEKISGRLEFGLNGVKWTEINFSYLKIPYKSRGSLSNYTAPQVELDLASEKLNLNCSLSIAGKLIKVSKLYGKYLNSEFSLEGNFDTKDAEHLRASAEAGLNIDLKDLKAMLPAYAEELDKIKPQGLVQAQCSFSGEPGNLKSCVVQAKLTSPVVTCFGLKATNSFLNYSQAEGMGEISLMRFSFYGGSADLAAKIGLTSPGLPFGLSLGLKEVKIEELKLDTSAKDQNISGSLQAQANISGYGNDFSKTSGEGKISILNGRLWELDLFKGIGKLVFVSDFAKITFSEGSCDFLIRDKAISTDNLLFKSEVTRLSGPVKIGFDGGLDATLNAEVDEDKIPISGTFKDITSIIMGKAGRIGTIKISGTLKEPKYKFQAAVVDLIKGLKDVFMGK
ncbi:MAG: DUF3971 domain-containing protein [Candidatus Omnitrophota bacterium]